MEWKFKGVTQETQHPFLNFYVAHYDVVKEDGNLCQHTYYLASRSTKEEDLRIYTQDFERRADGVLIGAYLIKDSLLYLLLEHQFRPALNHDVLSFPAGLCDKEDHDVRETAFRELKEETGYLALDAEVLLPPSPTSEGLSDECNSVVLCRLAERGTDHKEEFEDIQAKLYSAKEVKTLLEDPTVLFSNPARLLILYLLERFHQK